MAGSWLIASVCMLRMKHMSSTILAVYGSSSLTHMPHWPCWANLNFDGAIGKRAWPRGHRRQPLAHADRVGQVLVEPLVHLRLVVEQVHLRRAADHVQIDDVLGLGRRSAGRRRAPRRRRRRVAGAAHGAVRQQRGQRGRAEGVGAAARRTGGAFRCGPYSSKSGCMVSPRGSMRPAIVAARQASTCSAPRPDSSARWPASSRRPASPASSVAIGLRLADGDQLASRRRRVPRSSASRSAERRSTTGSSSARKRPGQQPAGDEVEPRLASCRRLRASARSARRRAASTNCGSFSVTSACSGVLVRSRRTVQVSRLGALKMSIDAGGAARFQNVYRLRR